MTTPINPGCRPAALRLLPPVHITANFKEPRLRRMRLGPHADVAVDAYPHLLGGAVESVVPWSGHEFSLLPSGGATGNFRKIVQRVAVRLELPREAAPARLLRPALPVTVTVDTCNQGEAAAADGTVDAAEATPASGQGASAR